MSKTQGLINLFKSQRNSQYVSKLKENFSKNILELDYSKEYIEELKNFLYFEVDFLIIDSILKEEKELTNQLIRSNNNTEKYNFQNNIESIKLIKTLDVIFSTSNLVLYISDKKIRIYKNGKHTQSTNNTVDDYLAFIKQEFSNRINDNNRQIFENDLIAFCLKEIDEDIDFVIDVCGKELWIEYSASQLFLQRFIKFQQNQIILNTPKLKNELASYIIGDNEINWIPSEPFSKLLENNETVIYENNSEYLLKFVKLDSFLTTKRKSLINIHKEIINTKNEDFIFKTIPVLINQIEFYNQMLLLAINMIVALKNNKMILFFKIYETFDQLGVFNSNWEKSLLNKVDELNLSIKDLITEIQQMEMRLNQKIEDLSIDIQSNIDDMKDNVIEEISDLKNLNDGSFNSILSLINTFQLIGIRNKLK